ncbi:HNH endonuclease signature motif containing protein [Streptomyces sp. NPDC051658]|uniref:HNH endonuclease signature motif containing protein n=1 Tax=Streptomyces sp. NPDC051658 TaxID=3365667 RepID=UPI0037A19379
MRRLDAPLASGPRRYLRIRLAHYDIDTSHFMDEPLPPQPARSYTSERLQEAAANSHSIREMLEFMGVVPYDSLYSHISRKLEKFGIDTAHFTGPRRQGDRLCFPREEITRAVAESLSMAGVMRVLGKHPSGGAGRAKAQRSIAVYELSTAHFVGQGHNAGRSPSTRRSAQDILQRLSAGAPRTKTALLRRALDETGAPQACGECGLGGVWQGKRLVLEIDHINGDRLDNRRENLRYLCPSCHSQTPSFSNRSHRLRVAR